MRSLCCRESLSRPSHRPSSSFQGLRRPLVTALRGSGSPTNDDEKGPDVLGSTKTVLEGLEVTLLGAGVVLQARHALLRRAPAVEPAPAAAAAPRKRPKLSRAKLVSAEEAASEPSPLEQRSEEKNIDSGDASQAECPEEGTLTIRLNKGELAASVDPILLPPPPPAGPAISPLAAYAVGAAVVLGAAARRIRPAEPEGLPLAAEAAARLAALEVLVRRQEESLSAANRILDKLSIRTRYLKKDMQDPLKRSESEVLRQGEVLVQLAKRVKEDEEELRGLQGLIEGMQGLSLKQFELVSQVIKKQADMEAQIKAAAATAAAAKNAAAAAAANASAKPSSSSSSPPPAPPSSRGPASYPTAPRGAAPSDSAAPSRTSGSPMGPPPDPWRPGSSFPSSSPAPTTPYPFKAEDTAAQGFPSSQAAARQSSSTRPGRASEPPSMHVSISDQGGNGASTGNRATGALHSTPASSSAEPDPAPRAAAATTTTTIPRPPPPPEAGAELAAALAAAVAAATAAAPPTPKALSDTESDTASLIPGLEEALMRSAAAADEGAPPPASVNFTKGDAGGAESVSEPESAAPLQAEADGLDPFATWQSLGTVSASVDETEEGEADREARPSASAADGVEGEEGAAQAAPSHRGPSADSDSDYHNGSGRYQSEALGAESEESEESGEEDLVLPPVPEPAPRAAHTNGDSEPGHGAAAAPTGAAAAAADEARPEPEAPAAHVEGAAVVREGDGSYVYRF